MPQVEVATNEVATLETKPEISKSEPAKVETPKTETTAGNLDKLKPATAANNDAEQSKTATSGSNLEKLKPMTAANNDAEKILQEVFKVDEKAVEATKNIEYTKISSTDYCGYSFDVFKYAGNITKFYTDWFGDFRSSFISNCYGKDGRHSGQIYIRMWNVKSMAEAQKMILENPFKDDNKIKNFKVTPIDKNTVIWTWIDTEGNVDVIRKIWVVGDRYENCAMQSVEFRYNVNTIQNESKVVAKHIFDSFKPGFEK